MYYGLDFGKIAKDVISMSKATPYNKEMLESWIEVAVVNNVTALYNTADIIED